MKEETPFLPFLTISSKEYYNLLKVAKHAKAILPHCKEVTSQYAFQSKTSTHWALEEICDEEAKKHFKHLASLGTDDELLESNPSRARAKEG